MSERVITIRSGDYLLSVLGLAAVRDVFHDADAVRRRSAEMRHVIEHADEMPFGFDVSFEEHDVEDGYTLWSQTYDAPSTNPAILVEEALVHPALATLPRGTALDVACGSGRVAAHLAALGHDVIGVDATEAMLALARPKVPTAEFRQGTFDALPVDDNSVDLVTCALALCHQREVATAIAEMARVLRPGGTAVISDMHPSATRHGGAAVFPGTRISHMPFVRNYVHDTSEYFKAFVAAGLDVRDLSEGFGGPEHAALLPSYAVFPEATTRAMANSPMIIAWTATKPM